MKKLLYFLKMGILFLASCNLAPGSYPYAEVYELGASEEKLIEATNKFKTGHPDFMVPEYIGLVDGRSPDNTDHWYHVWFFYKEENKIVYTWIRGNKFALISINEGSELGNWKNINKDFTRSGNNQEKRKFEERILNRIKESL